MHSLRPVQTGIMLIIITSCLVHRMNKTFCIFRIKLIQSYYATHTISDWCVKINLNDIIHIPKHIIGTSSNYNARFFFGNFANCFRLLFKQFVSLFKRCIMNTFIIAGIQITLNPLWHFKNLTTVIFYSEFFRKQFTDFLTAAAVSSRNRNNVFHKFHPSLSCLCIIYTTKLRV